MQLHVECQRAVIVVIALATQGNVAVAQEPLRTSHVRSDVPLIVEAISQGTERSPTFRKLLEAIDATDGLVYVEQGKCGSSVRACLRLSVQLSGPFRVLRILVTGDRARVCDLTASIGHELQHALEALSHRQVRSNAAIINLFARIGVRRFDRYETTEAQRTDFAVRKEACGSQRRMPS
jgi:hypothetical protein